MPGRSVIEINVFDGGTHGAHVGVLYLNTQREVRSTLSKPISPARLRRLACRLQCCGGGGVRPWISGLVGWAWCRYALSEGSGERLVWKGTPSGKVGNNGHI